MRIDLYNSLASQVVGEQGSQKVSGSKSAKSGASDANDRATLTSDSTSVGSMVSTALSSPEIRQDKVDSLKEAISSGNYQIDPGAIASAMIDEHA